MEKISYGCEMSPECGEERGIRMGGRGREMEQREKQGRESVWIGWSDGRVEI